ncbi:MAG: hypothetical protein KBS57_05940 [Alistipes sp.]|nr:hypothetical protein [Candidatus Minthomonas equi]
MKRFFTLLISVLILVPAQVSAQNSLSEEVTISKDKVRIDGVIYYVHFIKEGQTLLSISKAYDIPISAIQEKNPSSKNGLKPGVFLYIPTEYTPSHQESEDTVSPQTDSREKTAFWKKNTADKIKKVTRDKETKGKDSKDKDSQSEYKFRYKRGSSSETTATASASVSASVAATVEKPINKKENNEKNDSRKKTAKRTDKTRDDMETDQDNEQEDIDPDIAYKTNKPVKEEPSTPTVSIAVSSSDRKEIINSSASIDSDLYEGKDITNTISIVIPFGKSARYGSSEVNQSDFYSGVLLALYKLREEERFKKYSIQVIDLDKWDSTQEMLAGSAISGSDLIIGPISLQDAEPVAEFAKENHIPMVSPLDIRTSSLAEGNPYLFIFPSSPDAVHKRLIQRFTNCSQEENLIIITEKDKTPTRIATMAISALDSIGIKYRNYSYAILQNQRVISELKSMIPEDNPSPARILVASENEAFVSDALSNLNVLVTTGKRNISVFGLPKWRNFSTIQLEYLHHLNTHISLSYHLDYNSEETMDMTNRFEEVFHTSPTPFAYQGYDITKFFIEMMETYGPSFPEEIMDVKYQLIQSDIEFRHLNRDGGFYNSSVRDITYLPDWSIECE